eukprot:jgi/Mesvir1/29766/Mv19457-RA.1
MLLERLKDTKGQAGSHFRDADILRLLATTREKASGICFSRDRVLSSAEDIYTAGSDTTSSTLTFVLYHLSGDAQMQRKVLAEVDAGGDRDAPLSHDDALQGFPYIEWVVKETLRFYPTVTALPRQPTEVMDIKGYRVTPAMRIYVPTNVIHMDPKYFWDPDTFRPERFDPDGPEEQARPAHAFMPFGIGPRMCLGSKYAMVEAKMTLVRLFRRYTFARCVDTQVPPELAVSILIRPKAVKLRVIPR